MINWPVLLKHDQDAELLYIASESAWNAYIDECDASDLIIDISGHTYQFDPDLKQLINTTRKIELMDLLGLIKAHAAQKGSCCVAKLYAPTIEAAFAIVESLER